MTFVLGIWEVQDPKVPRHRHHGPANCLLLQMRVSIVIPLSQSDGTVTNKTIIVPSGAAVNGNCGERQVKK